MTTRNKIIAAVVALAAVFALGRYTVPTKVKIIEKIVEVEKKTDEKESNKERHKKTVITKKPDGTTETVITDDTESKSKEHSTDDKTTDSSKTTEITRSSGRLNISALGGVSDPFSGIPRVIYGGHISRDIIGLFSIGVWGLTDSTFGASIGISF